jgi:O-antigen ligase
MDAVNKLRMSLGNIVVGFSIGLGIVFYSGAIPTEQFLSFFDKSLIVFVLVCVGYIIRWQFRVMSFSLLPFIVLLGALFSLVHNSSYEAFSNLLAFFLIVLTAIVAVNAVEVNVIIWSTLSAAIFLSLWGWLDYTTMFPTVFQIVNTEQAVPIFHNQNIYGLSILIGIPAVLSLQSKSFWINLLRIVAFLVLSFSVYLSTSITALIALIAVVVSWVLFLLLRKNLTLFLGGIVLTLVSLIVALINSDTILGLLGKSPTFSGRVEIWEAVFTTLNSEAIFGFGWNTVIQPGSKVDLIIQDLTGWYWFAHVHNDLLQWLIMAGLISALSIFLMLSAGIIFGFIHLAQEKSSRFFFPVLVLILLSIQGLSEISTFRPQGWLMITVAITLTVLFAFTSNKELSSHRLLTLEKAFLLGICLRSKSLPSVKTDKDA